MNQLAPSGQPCLEGADRRRGSPFAEETLNNLASHHIVADEDSRADEVFRLMIECVSGGTLHGARVLARRLVGV